MNYTKDFETFWQKYPQRWNKDLGVYVKRKKQPAFLKWQRLSKEIRKECLAKVHLIKASEGSAVRDCVTWLNQEGWSDIDLTPKNIQGMIPKDMIESLLVDDKPLNINNERNKQRNLLMN